MKNLKRILLATALLLSASSMAKLVQPLNPVGEDSPFRVSLAAKGGFGANKSREFGPSGLGGGIGFTHNVGYNVEYGLGLAYDWTSPTGRIFAQNSKATEGNRIDTELFVRYMPELAERFNLGLGASFGWGRQFGQGAKVLNDGMKFGDLSFKVGPALSYGFSESVTMYFAAYYSMQNIRFGLTDNTLAKQSANWMGVDLPLGFWFSVADNAGIFVEANTRFYNLAKGAQYFKEEATLGMSFAI